MGFTPFPYAVTQEAVETVDAYLGEDADLVVMHFDNGVPWQEALDGAPYPVTIVADVDRVVAAADAGQQRVLQFTPINFLRDSLADGAGNAPLGPDWAARDFDDPVVIDAFMAHARWLIERTAPSYVNYAIEANLLFEKAPQRWDAFLRLLEAVYPTLKAEFPDIRFFVSIQLDAISAAPESQLGAIRQLLPYSDLVAVSTYPFISQRGVDAIPSGFLSDVRDMAPEKPLAISETGWPAEDLGDPYPQTVVATPGDQRDYLAWLLDECERLGCVFVNWFVVRDYDALFDEVFGPQNSLSATGRIWRDTGLYAGDGSERPALGLWREWLSLPLRMTR